MEEGLLTGADMAETQLYHQNSTAAWVTAHKCWEPIVLYTTCMQPKSLEVSLEKKNGMRTVWLISSWLYLWKLGKKGWKEITNMFPSMIKLLDIMYYKFLLGNKDKD